jgi:hypothetical protein
MRTDEERIEAENAAKSQMPCQPGKSGSNPRLNPMAVAYAIDRVLTPQSILVGDGGDFVGTCSYILRPRGPLQWLDPGPFGTLGVGAAFAIAAKLAKPSADVWLLWGDGSAGYSIMECVTKLSRDPNELICFWSFRGPKTKDDTEDTYIADACAADTTPACGSAYPLCLSLATTHAGRKLRGTRSRLLAMMSRARCCTHPHSYHQHTPTPNICTDFVFYLKLNNRYTDYDRVVEAVGCKGYKADTSAALAQHLAAASESCPFADPPRPFLASFVFFFLTPPPPPPPPFSPYFFRGRHRRRHCSVRVCCCCCWWPRHHTLQVHQRHHRHHKLQGLLHLRLRSRLTLRTPRAAICAQSPSVDVDKNCESSASTITVCMRTHEHILLVHRCVMRSTPCGDTGIHVGAASSWRWRCV